jgi:hypothetical protein
MRVEGSAFVVPAHLQSSPEFLIRYVQVSLRLLNARVAEHQLDDADVDAVSQQSACTFVPEVVPSEIDPLELLTIPRGTCPGRSRLDAVRQ